MAQAREISGEVAHFLEQGKYDAARRSADAAVRLLEAAGAEEPDEEVRRRLLGAVLVQRVFVRFSLEDLDGATADARRALDVLGGVVRRGDDPAAYVAADAQVWLAGLLSHAGRMEEVRELGTDQLDRFADSARALPGNEMRLAQLLCRYGGALHAIDDDAGGHVYEREGLEIYRTMRGELARDDRIYFAGAATTLAETLAPERDNLPEILAATEDAVREWSHLAGLGHPVIDRIVHSMYLRGATLRKLEDPKAVQVLVDTRFVLEMFYPEKSAMAVQMARMIRTELGAPYLDHWISQHVAADTGRWRRAMRHRAQASAEDA
ncbi:hypothetical protein ABZ897_54785 [Nonomuraea sp. NPDC046802]|uniref:hypothetical protein n=1 Tax=Nonomuraea sp. NPDC046802 TaxID=3154919 RepID=UPI003401542C